MKHVIPFNVYNNNMLRWLTFLAILLLLIACDRELPPAQEEQLATRPLIEHPWDLPGWTNPAAQQLAEIQRATMGNQVEVSTLRGPTFAAEDTLDPANLHGNWKLVFRYSNGQYIKVSPGNVHRMELTDAGALHYYSFADGDVVATLAGTWEKSAPGRLHTEVGGGNPADSYAQMFGSDFLFLWTYEPPDGMWFVREQTNFTQQIEHNRFSTTRGELSLIPVQQSWEGKVIGDTDLLDCTGFYHDGILTCDWQDEQLGTEGFAAFIVAPDWSDIQGVWWVADIEGSPFGSAWDGVALR